jgi:hypothetical protein
LLVLWMLTQLGIMSPAALGGALAALGALTVPLTAIAVRSVCHEGAARCCIPVLALAPWAVWTPAADGVTAAVAAAFVTLGVTSSEPGRRLWWAVACGLGIGVAALCGYGVAWLSVAVMAIYFVRRRPLLNVITGGCVLVPLSVAALLGFSWPDGLAIAHGQSVHAAAYLPGGGPGVPPWVARIPLDIAVVLVACGPTVIRAARRVRLTPGWPFLVGAVPAVGFGMVTGLAAAEVEHSWLPFYCWLLVPALAPGPRPAGPGEMLRADTGAGDPAAGDTDPTRADPLPLVLPGFGAVVAIVLRALLPPGTL